MKKAVDKEPTKSEERKKPIFQFDRFNKIKDILKRRKHKKGRRMKKSN